MMGEPNWIVEGSFDRPLPMPRVAAGGASLNAQFSTSELLKGKVSTTLSYETGVLGPIIQTSKGQTVNVSLQNNLSEETNSKGCEIKEYIQSFAWPEKDRRSFFWICQQTPHPSR